MVPLRTAFLVWGLAAAFYLFGFFQRVTPAALAPDLMREFALTAAGLGNLSAFYYYAYAAIQIPTGVLVDRIGPSRLLLAGALIAGVGAALFAYAQTFAAAALGRALIGGAHGLAWVSMLKLVAHWFPPARFGLLSGLSLMVGTLGAILAGPPLRLLSDAVGWRWVIGVSGVLALLLAGAIFKWVRDDPHEQREHGPASTRAAHSGRLLADLASVFGYRNVWLLALANSGLCGAFLAFTGLWGIPYLTQVHAISVARATAVTAGMLVLFALGAPAFGYLSDRWKRRKRPYLIGSGAMMVCLLAISVRPDTPLPVLVPLLFAGAFGSGSMALSFGYAKESSPLRLQGAATGIVNAGVMVGALTLMPLFGWILDRYWIEGAVQSGVRVYSRDAYQAAFVLFAAWISVSFLALAATRDTRAQQRV